MALGLRGSMSEERNRQRRRTRVVWMVALCVAILALFILYSLFDPTHSPFAPKCPFHLLTGLDCPACGNQRALHSLLSGELWLAFRYNPFLWLSLPYAGAVIYTTLFDNKSAQRCARIVLSRGALLSYVALFFIWWIIRNLPFWHSLVNLPE